MCKMSQYGITADVVSYNILIDGWGKQGNVASAEKWLDRMLSTGIEANTVCFNSMINAWARKGDVKKAEAWFAKLKDTKGKAQASANTYNIFLNACVRSGDT